MLKKAWTLAGKDFKYFYRDRAAVIGGYITPIIVLIVFGFVYSSMVGTGSGSDLEIRLVFMDRVKSDVSESFRDNLAAEDVFTIVTDIDGDDVPDDLTDEEVKKLILDGDYNLALVYEDIVTNPDFPVMPIPVMTLYYDPANDMARHVTEGLIQRNAFMNMGTDLPTKSVDFMLDQTGLSGTPAGDTLSTYMKQWIDFEEVRDEGDENTGMAGLMEGLLDLDTEEVIQPEVKEGNPYMANTLAGLLVMFLLFSVTHAAASLLRERQAGTIKRLLLAPISVDSIILGKFISISINSFLQLLMMLLFAAIFFRVNIFGNLVTILVISIATVAAVTAFGMIMAALARSYEQVTSASTVIILTMSAIGGSMFPRILMPSWMKGVGLLTINGWAIDGFLDALYRYNGLESILGYGHAENFVDFVGNSEALVLILFAVLCGWIAGRIFKRRLISDS